MFWPFTKSTRTKQRDEIVLFLHSRDAHIPSLDCLLGDMRFDLPDDTKTIMDIRNTGAKRVERVFDPPIPTCIDGIYHGFDLLSMDQYTNLYDSDYQYRCNVCGWIGSAIEDCKTDEEVLNEWSRHRQFCKFDTVPEPDAIKDKPRYCTMHGGSIQLKNQITLMGKR